MKTIVNKYNLYSEKEWNEKALSSEILYSGMVYKEDDIFFIEIGDNRFIVPSKNGMVKKRGGYSVLLNDKEVELLTRIKN